MINEIIFLLHSIIIAISALLSLWYGAAALTTFIVLQCIFANLMVLKQTTLFGLQATVADPFTIGAVLGLNFLQEYYGKDVAKRAININFCMLLLYTLLTQIHLWYLPNKQDWADPLFAQLFTFAPRIVIASLSVYYIVQWSDYYLYAFLKKSYQNNFFILRNIISIPLCQLLDTVLFSFFGLYGIVDNIGQIIMVSYLVKLFAMLITTPFIALSRHIIKRSS
jgi:uncharacterized integral membrane protein (TIGR00697 family)